MVVCTPDLVISEGKDSVWSYHLSKEGVGVALCGFDDVVPTKMGIEFWRCIGTVLEEPCQACQIKAFGWPDELCSCQEHPLYVACRLMDLYPTFADVARMHSQSPRKPQRAILTAAVEVLKFSAKFGTISGLDKADTEWLKLSGGCGPKIEIGVKSQLRKIFTDFSLHWK